MAKVRTVPPSLLVVAAFSRHDEALAWARARLEESYGPVALASAVYDFDNTDYYQATMGPGLRKQLLAFGRLVAPDSLPDLKHHTNALEAELAASGRFAEARPLNLDPGHLVLGKFLLATMKDHAHRVYLRDGVFAEVTLHYQVGGKWLHSPWTFADYRRPDVRDFLLVAREFYREQLQAAP